MHSRSCFRLFSTILAQNLFTYREVLYKYDEERRKIRWDRKRVNEKKTLPSFNERERNESKKCPTVRTLIFQLAAKPSGTTGTSATRSSKRTVNRSNISTPKYHIMFTYRTVTQRCYSAYIPY